MSNKCKTYSFSDKGKKCKVDCIVYYASYSKYEYKGWPVGMALITSYNNYPILNNVVVEDESVLVKPTSWSEIWNDKGGKGADSSFWHADPPSGYVTLGDIAVRISNTTTGSTIGKKFPNFRCVRKDLCK